MGEMGNTSFLWTGCHSSRVESSAIRRSMCLAAVILLRLLLQLQLLLRHRPRLLLRGQSHPLPLSLQPQLLLRSQSHPLPPSRRPQLLQTLLRPKLLLGLRPQLLLRSQSYQLPSRPGRRGRGADEGQGGGADVPDTLSRKRLEDRRRSGHSVRWGGWTLVLKITFASGEGSYEKDFGGSDWRGEVGSRSTL